MSYINRTLKSFFEKADKSFPVLLLTGMRQVGKTTFLRHLDDKRTYVTLDDPIVRNLAKTDPALFMQRYTSPIIIDEIQYAPELLPYIKIAVDHSNKSGQFWLTGSQQFHLMKDISESLAGRIGIINMYGLSLSERFEKPTERQPFLPDNVKDNHISIKLPELYQIIWRGAFPKVVTDTNLDWELFYSSYIQTYLQRDVRDLTKVGDEMAFLRFLKIVAARTGQVLNMADIARDAAISPNTVKSWLSILETSGIVYFLQPWYSNINSRLIKQPKIYFTDTGLCSYLTDWLTPQALESGAMSGAIFETWVVTEIMKSYANNGKTPPLYYYRDKDKREIDLIINNSNTLHPIEIKKTASPDKSMIKSFKSLEHLNLPIGHGAIICLSEHFIPLTAEVDILPVGYL